MTFETVLIDDATFLVPTSRPHVLVTARDGTRHVVAGDGAAHIVAGRRVEPLRTG